MAAVQLLVLLAASCAAARPPRPAPPCQVVQMDVFCSDLSLRRAPDNLPSGVQTLDLSRNHVQNLTQETLRFHTGLRHLNLHGNRIHFIQPGLFRDMSDLRVLDLSRNHLNVFAHSKTNVGPLTAVESLDLSSNGLYTGMSDYFLSDSPSLTELRLNYNSITKVQQHTFKGSASLQKISLHNNVILEIEDGAFESLERLTELDLSKNSITCIIDFNLYNLRALNLSKNSVEFFQSAQSDRLFKLRSLDLSNNKMVYLPILPQDNVLEHLDVSRNHIQTVNETEISVNGSAYGHLRHLDMSYNNLKSIPESFFTDMRSLEVLNVSNNCMSSFSVTAKGLLRRVKVLNLSHNLLQNLTFGENTLHFLQKLYLQGNQLAVLDQQIFRRLPCLKLLQLQKNQLEVCAPEPPSEGNPTRDCVSFSALRNLRYLHLAENNLKTLPANAFANTSLKFLDLSLNPGVDIHKDSFSGLEQTLVHLLLRENQLAGLDADLSSLKSLKHVDLSSNQLKTLPAWSGESAIESLNLQSNRLVSVDHSAILALQRSLKTLYMGSNPLSCCHSLGLLHMVQHSAVVVPDIEAVTCLHEEHPEPVPIGELRKELCRRPEYPNYTVIVTVKMLVVVLLVVAIVLLVLLVRCLRSRRKRRKRGFRA